MKKSIYKLSYYVTLLPLVLLFYVNACRPGEPSFEERAVRGEVITTSKVVDDAMNLKDLELYPSSTISTEVFELDGYHYRVFWMGDGIGDASLFVINLEEQEAKMNYYRSNTAEQ
jgi:hypothetical protein